MASSSNGFMARFYYWYQISFATPFETVLEAIFPIVSVIHIVAVGECLETIDPSSRQGKLSHR